MNQLFIDYYWPIDVLLHMLFVLPLLGAVLRWVTIWQIKEYRWDRFRDFWSTRSGRRFIASPWAVLELVGAIYLLSAQSWGSSNVISFIFLPWCLLVVMQCVRVVRQPLRPTWTMRATLTALLSLATIAILYVVIRLSVPTTAVPTTHFGVLATLLLIAPLIVTGWVEALRPLVQAQFRGQLHQAKTKIQQFNPIVIGITGSYGKTSAKHFLATLLETRWKVLATPKNVNSDVGVAHTILTALTQEHDIFIVEMGAYRRGEIAAICDIVSPIIGVVTAVSGQHLSLFGSLEAIKQTKAELLRALPSSGVAIINRDLEACRDIAQYSQAPVRYISVQDTAHVYASALDVTAQQIRFTLHIGAERALAQVNLHGKQVLPAVLAAVAVAHHLGLSLAEIVTRLDRLTSPSGTMQLKNGRHHYNVIDDSYNANPDGFLAALDYLALFSDKRKVIITPGMLELGTDSDAHHRSVGTRIGEVADQLIITKRDFAEPLRQAAIAAGMAPDRVVVEERMDRLIRLHLDPITTDDVVLVEGRVQKAIRNFLIVDPTA